MERKQDQPPAENATFTRSGRPRRSTQPALDKGLKDRRRAQVRIAQQAYRARNQANITALQRRVAQLETALESMGEAVVSFSGALVESDVLTSYPHVADRLRDTVQTCLALARHGEGEHLEDHGSEEIPRIHTPPDELGMSGFDSRVFSHLVDPTLSGSREAFHAAYRSGRLFPFGLDNIASRMEVPAFVEQLRIACLYQGFLVLNNPSIPLDVLRRPFRLLLSLVTREAITLFFRDRLHARLAKRQAEGFSEIPGFKLGGAGTHYPGVFIQPQDIGLQQPQAPEGYTLSAFSPEVQQELDGDWFDVHDLEGYLREKEVSLMIPQYSTSLHSSPRRVVDAVDLTAALLRKGICLGYSPGFKRSDVESAIDSSSWRGA
ncbi:hypothetical protein BDW59DRAFT_56172 [Aspergillus cavernicola]|uniref:BZIP domain-containing protein n=1 Tax=Aspergillus cavernicola TaxID=176166 RepID=A0ABR4III5_9EURO